MDGNDVILHVILDIEIWSLQVPVENRRLSLIYKTDNCSE